MSPDSGPHALLRIDGAQALTGVAPLPRWAQVQLARTPWVVVRRAAASAAVLPVGIRGAVRGERLAAWLPRAAVREAVTPQQLAARAGWRAHPRAGAVAALAALEAVARLMAAAALAWGPTGSVGFELATGAATAHAASDLDLILSAPSLLSRPAARELYAALARLPVRCDVQLDTPRGGLALAEYLNSGGPFLLRTAHGPLRSADPWRQCEAAG
jgi:phosphoribosyl-dephospho-CoA transferase